MLTQDDLEQERNEAERKERRDRLYFAEYGIEEAFKQQRQQGLYEGLMEGRREGQVLGRLQLCQRVLGIPVTPQDQLLGQSVADLENIASALEKLVVRLVQDCDVARASRVSNRA